MVITTSINFIDEFHNIQGDRVGLRKQNLYKILKSSRLTSEEQQLLAHNLKPKNYLEVVFHADVLIYFKITNILLEFLRNGHEIYVSKIIKQHWFFEEVFKNVSPNQLVDEVLPSLSYSVKVKLLKKLLPILSPEQVNKVFDNLLNKYGLYFATKVVTGCSSEKIRNTIKAHDIKLSFNDLKLLFKKDFSLIESYFEEKKSKKYDEICTESFYKYLAENNPEYFLKVLKFYKPYVKLGRRVTKKVLKHVEKREIINDPKTYISCFKNERVVRILNYEGQLPEFFKNLYPEELPNVQDECILKTILKYYPRHKRYDLFKIAFEQVYNENLLHNYKFIDKDLLELFENEEFRIKWAHLKFTETGNIEYLGYYNAQEAIPLIKERINLTSQLTIRNKLLASLLKCCAINSDIIALEEVLQYFCNRHRNAVYTTRERFLVHFRNNFKNRFTEFTDTVWKYFIEIVTIQLINNEYDTVYNNELIGKYIAYLYKKNEETQAENIILKFLPKPTSYYHGYPHYEDYLTDVDIQKKIVVAAYKFFKAVPLPTNEDDKNRYTRIFANRLLKFNKLHPEQRIVYNKEMQCDIKYLFQKEDNYYELVDFVLPTLCKNDLDDFEKELLALVWEHLFHINTNVTQSRFLKWFCTYQPTTLVQHFDKIVKMFLCNSANLQDLSWFRSFSHLGLDHIIKKYCLNELSDETSSNKLHSVLWLSHQLSTEDYINIGTDKDLFPINLKLDTENQEGAAKFTLQKLYIENIKNTPNPLKYLPLILEKYCQGDFLQAGLPPVYKAFSKIPEESLMPYLKSTLQKKNISLSKHAAVLACNVFNQNTVVQTLKEFEKVENKSLKKSVFRSALKYFSKSPTEELYNIVLIWLQFLTEQDLESLKSLFEVKVDKNYQEEYLQHTWKLLKRFKDSSEIRDIKHSCLKALNMSNFEKLTNDFCKEIIQTYFLTEPELDEIYLFVINFLLFNKQEEYFTFVFQIILNFKFKHWSDFRPSNAKKINRFVKAFVSVANETEVELYVLERFMKNWETIFLSFEVFEDYLLLTFIIFWKNSSCNLATFASQIMQCLKNLRIEYNDILTNFASALSHFLDFLDEKATLNLFLSLMESSDLTLASSLVIELLSIKDDFVCDDRIKKKYLKIDTVLKQALNNNTIKLKYNLLLSEF